jgi:hypothetical protein
MKQEMSFKETSENSSHDILAIMKHKPQKHQEGWIVGAQETLFCIGF